MLEICYNENHLLDGKSKVLILSGKRVGKLVATEWLKGSKYVCQCDCGNTRTVSVGHFNAEYFKDCGCSKHGHACGNENRSREYNSWSNMMQRCHNPKNKRYKDYGEKGIVVCDRWKESFKDFITDMGKCPDKYQIDRIDNNGIYEPDNCRWVSAKDNIANRGDARRYIVDGKVYESSTAAREDLGVSTATIRAWCIGRKVGDKFYPPKNNCYVESKY